MLKSCEAFFVIMPHLKPFVKQFASSTELVSLLRSRGLYIDNQQKTENYLDNIGYIQSLFSEFPEVDLGALGFPMGNWHEEPIWNNV